MSWHRNGAALIGIGIGGTAYRSRRHRRLLAVALNRSSGAGAWHRGRRDETLGKCGIIKPAGHEKLRRGDARLRDVIDWQHRREAKRSLV